MRRVAVIALVIAVSAIVAMAGTGVGLFVPPAVDAGWLWLFRIGGGVAAVTGLAALLLLRRRLPAVGDRAPDPTAAALASAATIMCVLLVSALLAPRAPQLDEDPNREPRTASAEDSASGAGSGSAGLLPQASGSQSGGAGGPGRSRGGRRNAQTDRAGNPQGTEGDEAGILDRLSDGLLLLLVFIGLVSFLALTGRLGRASGESPLPVPVSVADAEAGFEASLGEVSYAGSDPRSQITAAYHRLLAALAAAGAPREPQEAPYEYLNRALGPLGVRPEPMHRLTELYVIAQFSAYRVTEHHRVMAVESLEDGLLGLRTARAAAEPAAGIA